VTVPDPALVVLVGPTSSGKSSWAAARYRAQEIVSSDALRGVVGSGELDVEASVDAFALLDQIVAARSRRGLTTVVEGRPAQAGRSPSYRAARLSALITPRSDAWTIDSLTPTPQSTRSPTSISR
jgi:hypothetical protein